MVEDIRFYNIEVADLLLQLKNTQNGKQTTIDSLLGFAPWGAKNLAGDLSLFLEKDKRAVVSELVASGGITNGRAITVPASGTDFENGAALLAALTAVKNGTYPAPSIPSAAAPTFIYLPGGGTYDLQSSKLNFDTDHIYLISDTPAQKISDTTSYGTAVKPAGATIKSSADQFISVSAICGFKNINIENLGAFPAVYIDTTSSIFFDGCSGTTLDPQFIEKSAANGTVSFNNCHFEKGINPGSNNILINSGVYGGNSFTQGSNQSVNLFNSLLVIASSTTIASNFICRESSVLASASSINLNLSTVGEKIIDSSKLDLYSISFPLTPRLDVVVNNSDISIESGTINACGKFTNNRVNSFNNTSPGSTLIFVPTITSIDSTIEVLNNMIVVDTEDSSIGGFGTYTRKAIVNGNSCNKELSITEDQHSGVNFVNGEVVSTPIENETTSVNIPDISTATPTKKKLSDLLNQHVGRGIVSGGLVTANATNPLTEIDVAAGEVWLSNSATAGNPSGFQDVPGATGLAVIANVPNYVYAQWGASGATWAVTDNPASISFVENIAINEIVFPNGSEILITEVEQGWSKLSTSQDQRATEMARGRGNPFLEWADGATIGTTGARYVTMTPGIFWAGEWRRVASPEFNTDTGGDTLFSFHRDGASGHTKTTGLTQLDNVYYDDGTGTLAALSPNRFTNRWLYLDYSAANLGWVYDTAQYTTITDAENATPPADVPAYISQFSVFVGRITVQQGVDTTTVVSAFGGGIATTPVTSHTQLSNINTDPTIQHMTEGEKTEVARLTTDTITFTANDQNDDFSVTSAKTQIFTGNYFNCSRDLPAANGTDMFAGWEIKVVNTTDYYTHVYNSDKSKVIHIPKKSAAVFTCLDTSTAAGEWSWKADLIDPCSGYDLNDETLEGIFKDYTEFDNSQTGATIGSNKLNGWRCSSLQTGTTATGAAGIRYLLNSELDETLSRHSGGVAFNFLSSATDTYKFKWGWGNQSSFGDGVEVGFLYNYNGTPADNSPGAASSSPYWQIFADDGVTPTYAITTELVTTTFQWLTIIRNSNSRIDFWIGSTHVGSITTGINAGSATYFRTINVKSAGTNNRLAYITNLGQAGIVDTARC